MNKLSFFLPAFFLSMQSIHAQKNIPHDTTTVLSNDIYSNNDKGSYRNTAPIVFIKNPGDTTKLERSYYPELTGKANRCYARKEFAYAVYWYTSAFTGNHDLGMVDDRFKAACCYAMLNNKDSAFLQLYRITAKGHYTNLNELSAEPYLKSLHSDKRWQEIIDIINKNRAEMIEKMNKELSDKKLPAETNQ